MDLTAGAGTARVSRRKSLSTKRTRKRTGNLQMPVALTIYHNPQCSKSMKTLKLIRESGVEPTIVEYLGNPPEAATILKLAKWLGIGVADLLRTSDGDETDETLSLDEHSLARWLQDHPEALQRPIVVDEAHAKACIGRPPENVLALLR
jgi:arsenate reductase